MSLRTYLALLKKTIPDQLVTIKEEVDWRYELTKYVSDMEKRPGNPAVLFENIKDYDMPVLVNLFGSVDRISLGVGEAPCVRSRLGFYDEWNRLFVKDVEPVKVKSGPVKDVKLLGKDVDLNTLPIPRFYEEDGGRYITAGLFLAKNPDDPDEMNLSFVRMHLQGKDSFGVSFHSRGHMWQYFEKAKQANEPLDAAVIIGAHPTLSLAAAAKITDEYAKAGALMGEAVKLVDCETVDLQVPAESEIVLEGKVLLDEMAEGPFTEYTGYISGRSTRNHFKVSGILRRKDSIFMAVAPNNSAEHLLLSGLPKQARISRAVIDFTHLPVLEDINWPVWGTHFVCFMGLKENVNGRGLAKQMGALLLGLDHYVKFVAALPHGVDLSDSTMVLGAIAERCDFIRGSGLDILGGVYSHLLDPSSREPGISSKLVLDATGARIQSKGGALKDVEALSYVLHAAYPYQNNPVLCAVTSEKNVENLQCFLDEETLAGSRLIILVDEDIDLRDGRQLLWALATRLQPAERSLCLGGRLVLDARMGEGWTARRATLPFS